MVLVLDVRAMGASVAAVAEGCVRFREDVDVTGLVLNRVGSEAHDRALREALDARLSTPVLSAFPQLDGLSLHQRLGLKTLLLPGGLGSTHKVLIFGKAVGKPSLKGCSYAVRLT